VAGIWDQARVQSYIDDEVEESLNLDYKAAGELENKPVKKKDITKDISAFANSDGGIIIYGISEHPTDRHLPSRIDPVNRQDFSKEWLEHVIGNIRPRIDGLLIHPVPIGGSNSDVVYIVQIPQSHTAHQATDKRYYKRHNFESVPMDDYEIRDVMNRLQHPRIELDFRLRNVRRRNGSYDLEIFMANTGSVYALYVVARIEVPLRMVHDLSKHGVFDSRRRIDHEKVATFRRDNTIRDVVGISGSYPNTSTRYGPKRYDPLLPTLRFKTDSVEVSGFINDAYIRGSVIRWTTYADSAPAHSGEVAISDIPIDDGTGRILYLRDD